MTRIAAVCLALTLAGTCGCRAPSGPAMQALSPTPEGLALLDADTRERIRGLEEALTRALGHSSDDAYRIAHVSAVRCLQLREEYNVTMPAWGHNLGVLLGTAKRGYCCHWTRDLLDTLEPLEVRDFVLTWSVAFYGTPREHSCLVAVPVGKPFEEGIVIDGWRHGGEVFWTRVADDHDWNWTPRPTLPGTRIECGD